MPPTGTEEKKKLILALVLRAHIGWKGEPAAKILLLIRMVFFGFFVYVFFFFLLAVVFLKRAYEIEPGTMICPFLKACRENH